MQSILDDVGNTSATAHMLTLGAGFSGAINTVGDIDIVQFQGQGNTPYAIELFNLDGSPASTGLTLTLLPPGDSGAGEGATSTTGGTWMSASLGLTSSDPFTATFRISSNGGSPGSYWIVVNGPGAAPAVPPAAVIVPPLPDLAAPAAPSITSDAGAQAVSSFDSPILRGSAEEGSTVKFYVAGSLYLGSTVAHAGGGYAVNLHAFFGTGSYLLTATATDAAGNVSAASAPYQLLAYQDDVGNNKANYGVLSPGTAFKGSIEAAGDVDVFAFSCQPGARYAIDVVGRDGADAGFSVTALLADGSEGAGAARLSWQQDSAGTLHLRVGAAGGQTGNYDIRIREVIADVLAPAAPQLSAVLEQGGVGSSSLPVFQGSAEAGSTIKIMHGGSLAASTVADANGNFSVRAGGSYAPGSHGFTASATDENGNVSVASTPYFLAVYHDDTGNDAASATLLTIGTVYQGRMDYAGDTDVFAFDVPANAKYLVQVLSADAVGVSRSYVLSSLQDGGASTAFGKAAPHQPLSLASSTGAGYLPGVSPMPTFSIGEDLQQTGAYTLKLRAWDDTPPPAPTARFASSGTAASGIAGVITGKAAPGAWVWLKESGKDWVSTYADTQGNYEYHVTYGAAGAHTFAVTVLDEFNNRSAPTYVSVGQAAPADTDLNAPARPSLTAATLEAGVGSSTLPLFTGQAEAGSTVRIMAGASLIGTTTADPMGNYALRAATALTAGNYSFSATATDASGNQSMASAPCAVTVYLDDAGNDMSNSLALGVGSAFAGTLEAAGDEDVFHFDALEGVSYRFELVPGTDGGSTRHYLLAQLGPDGNSGASSASTALAPAALLHAAGPAQTVFLRVNENNHKTGNYAIKVTQADSLALPAPTLQLSGGVNGSIGAGTILVIGTAQPGILVWLTEHGQDLGQARADSQGNYRFELTTLDSGAHTISATARDTMNNTSPATPLSITVTPASTAASQDDVGGDLAGSRLLRHGQPFAGSLENAGDTDVFRYTKSAGMQYTVELKTGGQPDGMLQLTPLNSDGSAAGAAQTVSLADGMARLVLPPNAAGSGLVRVSALNGKTAGYTLSLSEADVGAPVVSRLLVDGFGSGDGSVSGILPSFSGQTEAHAQVEIKVGGLLAASGQAAQDGSFWLRSTILLKAGAYSALATVRDGAGNLGTAPLAFTVVEPAPAPPRIGSWAFAQSGWLNDATPELWGDANLGTTVQIWHGATLLASAVPVPQGGSWQLNLPALADGAYELTAVAVSYSGLVSAHGAPLRFTLDSVAPAAPTVVLKGLANGVLGSALAEFSGTAEAHARISVGLGSVANMASTMADRDGNWSTSLIVIDGQYQASVTASDAAGNASSISTLSFTRTSPGADDAGNSIAAAATLRAGTDFQGSLETLGDTDWFRISLEALTAYRFTLQGALSGAGTLPTGSGSLSFTLWDPQANGGLGGIVYPASAANQQGEPGMLFANQRAGDYYLMVQSAPDTGTYTLSTRQVSKDDNHGDQAHAVALAAGGQVSGTAEQRNDVDSFKLALTSGKTYRITMSADGTLQSGFNRLWLTGSDGAVVANWGSSSGDRQLELIYTADASANHFFYLSSWYVGKYVVKAVEINDDFLANTSTAGRLVAGGSSQGMAERAYDSDWFRIDLEADVSYTFQIDHARVDWPDTLTLRDSAGKALHPAGTGLNNQSILSWTPATSGTYYLDARLALDQTAYTLHAGVTVPDDFLNRSETAGMVRYDQPLEGRIAHPFDVDWIKLPVKAGNVYLLKLNTLQEGLRSDMPYGAVSIVDDLGQGRHLAHASEMVFHAQTDEVLFVQVRSGDNFDIFSYTLSAAVVENDAIRADYASSAALAPGQLLSSSIDYRNDQDWIRVELQQGLSYTFELTGAKGQGGTLASPRLALTDASGPWAGSASALGRGGDQQLTVQAARSGTYFVHVSGDAGGSGSYTLKMGSGAVALADTHAPSVTTFAAPTTLAGAGLAGDIRITFDEKVQAGSGGIALRLASGELVENLRFSFDAGGTVMTIDPAARLLHGTSYQIGIEAGAVKDFAGHAYASATIHSFRTAEAPAIQLGGAGADVFRGTNGDDTIDGGAGIDRVAYTTLLRKDVLIERSGTALKVTALKEGQGVDSLAGVERISFADDSALAFDLGGSAGQLYRLYRAAFDRAPDLGGISYWLAALDGGTSLESAAFNFIASAEFKALYGGGLSNQSFVAALYTNVMHRQGEQPGIDFWTAALQHGVTRHEVLIEFSESAENQAAVIGLIENGIAYNTWW